MTATGQSFLLFAYSREKRVKLRTLPILSVDLITLDVFRLFGPDLSVSVVPKLNIFG